MPELVANIVARLDQDALLLEPRKFFDAALVDATASPKDHWPRQGSMTVAVYDRDKCIEAIQKWLECDEDAALDWYCYNTEGAWLGEGTPKFRGCSMGYVAGECPACADSFCAVCQKHSADCDCPDPAPR